MVGQMPVFEVIGLEDDACRPDPPPFGLHRLSSLNAPLGLCMGVCAGFCASVPWVVIVGLGLYVGMVCVHGEMHGGSRSRAGRLG